MSSSPEDGGLAAFSAPPKCATYVTLLPATTLDYTLTLSFLISTIVLTLKFSRLPYHLCHLLVLLTLIKLLLRCFFSRILQLQYCTCCCAFLLQMESQIAPSVGLLTTPKTQWSDSISRWAMGMH